MDQIYRVNRILADNQTDEEDITGACFREKRMMITTITHIIMTAIHIILAHVKWLESFVL